MSGLIIHDRAFVEATQFALEHEVRKALQAQPAGQVAIPVSHTGKQLNGLELPRRVTDSIQNAAKHTAQVCDCG
jgi:hypothetical protein